MVRRLVHVTINVIYLNNNNIYIYCGDKVSSDKIRLFMLNIKQTYYTSEEWSYLVINKKTISLRHLSNCFPVNKAIQVNANDRMPHPLWFQFCQRNIIGYDHHGTF